MLIKINETHKDKYTYVEHMCKHDRPLCIFMFSLDFVAEWIFLIFDISEIYRSNDLFQYKSNINFQLNIYLIVVEENDNENNQLFQ